MSLEEELPSASVENHATAESTNRPSDEVQPANEGSAENDELNN